MNWWEDFFSGLSVRVWLDALPAEHTEREADRLDRLLAVSPGAELLDVPCGGGRLSLSLCARGYRLTGVDLSDEFLSHARASPGAERVVWERRDMRDLPWSNHFDGAFCVGNSFGYLDDQGNAAFLRSVAAALKPGAHFVLETPMVLELLLRHLHDRMWWKVGRAYLLVANTYDHAESRLEIEYTFVSDGRTEVRYGSHRAYTYAELRDLLTSSGFDVRIDGDPWTRDTKTITLVGTRR